MLKPMLAALALLAIPVGAAADMIEKSGRFGGLQVTYKVLLPPNYDAARAYPVVLVFTGGPQQLRMAENTINTDWRGEAEKRGYIVVSPGTPDGSLFFEEADRIFPEFLDTILRDYKVAGGKLHVAGHSNGGLSAWHVAAKHPSYFRTVTGYPGLLDGEADAARMQALKPLCLFMHVGDQDAGWLSAMQRQADNLARQGHRIKYTVEKNQVHRLRASEINLSPRLFDQIEGCRP
jgi:poly(3-hydroxybutyrate) depolymerase